jgi:hypothetical protein
VSVTDFCRQLGVSVTTSYYWMKRIHEVAANGSGQNTAECPSPISDADVPSLGSMEALDLSGADIGRFLLTQIVCGIVGDDRLG